jgi:hypothetical protein
VVEPITQEMREKAASLERLADANIQEHEGHRFVDVHTREKAVNLLLQFGQGFPSNQEFKNYAIGPRFTWRMLKSFAEKLFDAVSDP